MYDDNRNKPLHVILKTSAYIMSYDEKTKWMWFLIDDDYLLGNIIPFVIKSVLISKTIW